jgi:hypothetical protein
VHPTGASRCCAAGRLGLVPADHLITVHAVRYSDGAASVRPTKAWRVPAYGLGLSHAHAEIQPTPV